MGGSILRRLPLLLLLSAPLAAADPLAQDVAHDLGLTFSHANNAAPWEPRFAEKTAGGLCWGDYDRDGWIDLYVTDTTGGDGSGLSRLYRNLGGTGTTRFLDVTAGQGAGLRGLGQGCAWGDYDNDGWPDLVVTFATTADAPQGTTLLHNRGAGRGFEDATRRAGIGGDSTVDAERCRAGMEVAGLGWRAHCWSVGAAWLDHDLDGDLDLYLANYAELGIGPCPERGKDGPQFCLGGRNRLWRNEANGSFTEIGGAAGVAVNAQPSLGRSLGVVATDVDGDAWPDLYVANDLDGNALYLNRRDGSFRNAAPTMDVETGGLSLLNPTGFRSGMGVDATDLDGDARVDLLSTHLFGEFDAVYLTSRNESGWGELGNASTAMEDLRYTETRWGGGFVDLDRDGRRDYLVATGGQHSDGAGPIQLALSRDDGLELATAPAWPFGRDAVDSWRNYRGLAFADYDNDGDADVAVSALDWYGPRVGATPTNTSLRLLRFDAPASTWLRVALVGTDNARDVVGAHVRVAAGDGRVHHAWSASGGSYASGSDGRLLFALGSARNGTVEVVWPGGERQTTPFDLGADAGADLVVVESSRRAPPPVTIRGVTVVDGGLRLQWSESWAADFAAYRITSGTEVVAEVTARATTAAVVPATSDLRVTVVDASGRSSAPSDAALAVELPAPAPKGGPWLVAGALATAAVAATAALAVRFRRRG